MMSNNKDFSLRTVLSVTTGRLLTKRDKHGNGIGDLYELLGHMTGGSPMTHQLPRFGDECKPVLLETFPILAKADVDRLDQILGATDNGYAAVEAWLEECKANGLPETLSIGPIAAEGHVEINPIDELIQMRGGSIDGVIIAAVE